MGGGEGGGRWWSEGLSATGDGRQAAISLTSQLTLMEHMFTSLKVLNLKVGM